MSGSTVLSKISGSQKLIPAAIEFVDIAGLVKGASQGEGLGNKFLSHIREVDAIVQVVRCFENGDIHHVSGTVDPGARHRGHQHRADPRRPGQRAQAQAAAWKRTRSAATRRRRPSWRCARSCIPHLDAGQTGRSRSICTDDDERSCCKSFFLLSGKPCIFACNVAEADLAAASNEPDKHPLVSKVREYVSHAHSASAVVISAEIESELTDLAAEEAQQYLADLGVADSGVTRLIKSVYHLLGLQTYLTTGEKETRAWTITKGTKAPQAAGVIHSDFERGFIAGEIVPYDDLVELGSYAKCREKGKLRIEGKEYVMKDGDVVEWRFNV